MAENKAFLARVYELSKARTPTELARWIGLSLTAILNWESGKSSPQFKTLWRIREKTGEDLSSLVEPSGGQRDQAREAIHGVERGMQPLEMTPELADIIEGVKEIFDSEIETVITALKANIRAFRLSARALKGKKGRRVARHVAPEETRE